MKKLLCSVILLWQNILISAEVKITISAKPNETEVQIKQLEKTKEELLRKIHGAIDDSVVALGKTNDSESAKGVQYLSQLKKQIEEINSEETDTENNNATNVTIENIMNANMTEPRKNLRRAIIKKEDKKKYISYDLFGITKGKKRYTTIQPDREAQVEKEIEEWLKMKALEKEKIKKYKQQQRFRALERENCPNFGRGKGKKSSAKRSKKKKQKNNYPCCRKCCKQSYLGCL